MEEKTEKQLKKISKGFWIFFFRCKKNHTCLQSEKRTAAEQDGGGGKRRGVMGAREQD